MPPSELLTRLLENPEAIRAEKACRGLAEFVRQTWPLIEPSRPLVWGPHMDAVCLHLEAVSRGEIANLAVEIPPGSGKSTMISVCWPVWHWLTKPETRFLTASYAMTLAVRDALRSRRILTSPWFLSRWGDRFRLTGDQNMKSRYENDKTGYRISLSVGSATTGERGDITLIDDPHNVREAESEAIRRDTILWHDEAFYNRINDAARGGRVVMGQRTHRADLIGHLLDQGGWEELRIPEEFEAGNACRTRIGWQDWRTADGELMRPGRFGPEQVADAKKRLGPYAFSSQHQQRPAPREGGLFRRQDLSRIVHSVPMAAARVWYWDKGYSALGDFTAGVLMARDADGMYYVENVVRGRWEPNERNRVIKATLETTDGRYGRRVRAYFEQPPGAGAEAIGNLLRQLAGHSVAADLPRGRKEERAEPLADQCAAGNVSLVSGPWNEDFIRECVAFPNGENDDQVDGASGAFLKLTKTEFGPPAAGGQRPDFAAGVPSAGRTPPGRSGPGGVLPVW